MGFYKLLFIYTTFKKELAMKRLLCVFFINFFMATTLFATININTASESELETLNGIGPTRAKAIIEYRQQQGAFKSIEGIKNVSGIKDAVYLKIKNDIAISGLNTSPIPKDKPLEKAEKAEKATNKTMIIKKGPLM